jgi:hypothetical protein
MEIKATSWCMSIKPASWAHLPEEADLLKYLIAKECPIFIRKTKTATTQRRDLSPINQQFESLLRSWGYLNDGK